MWDREKVKETVTVGMRMLDNVIDLNFYPTIEGRNSNMRHRPVGLGAGGYQDALYQLNINFDSEENVRFADESMEMISYYAILASTELARERGAYESFKGSKWDRGILPVDTIALLEAERGETIDVSRDAKMDWTQVREAIKKHGMRNSNCMAIAPTASTSNIVAVVPSVEPVYKNIYVEANISGDFTVVNPYLVEELKRLNLWNESMLNELKYQDGSVARIAGIPQALRDKYKETFQIDMRWLIKAAAYRAKWIDQSQSINIFFSGSSGKELSEIYFYAWIMGLKTTYYLRTLAATQVEKSTVSTKEFGSTHTRDHASQAEAKAVAPAPVASVPAPAPAPVASAVPVAPVPSPVMATAPRTYNLHRSGNDDICESCQ
jgi:ribonucleoside-diphosphate reductase alpha chain